jgi:hypothetical protein
MRSEQQRHLTTNEQDNDNDLIRTIQTCMSSSFTTSGNVPTMGHFAWLFSQSYNPSPYFITELLPRVH